MHPNRSATSRNVYLEVEVQDGRHVGALRETLQGRQKEGESHGEVFARREGKKRRRARGRGAGTHLLLLQVVADGEVPVARLALRLEPGMLGRDTPAQHVANQLTGFTHKLKVIEHGSCVAALTWRC